MKKLFLKITFIACLTGSLFAFLAGCNGGECEHFFTSEEVYNCAEQSYTLFKCTKCDYNYKGNFRNPHRFGEYQSLCDATCATEGHEQAVCSLCSAVDVREQVGSKLPHVLELKEAVKSTCSEEGYIEHYSCVACDADFADAYGLLELTDVTDYDYQHDSRYGYCRYCEYEIVPTDGIVYEPDENGEFYVVAGFEEGYVHDDSSKNIIIASQYQGKPVKEIKERAFYDQNLNSVYIPDSVEIIGAYAFGDSYDNPLNNVRMSSNVKWIGMGAFYRLQEPAVKKHDGVGYIGNKDNPYVVAVIVNQNGAEVKEGAKVFYGDDAWTDYDVGTFTLPGTVEMISAKAFASYESLYEIIVPDSVTRLDDYAFADSDLRRIVVGDGVTELKANSFLGQRNLKELVIGASVTSVHPKIYTDSLAESKLEKLSVDENNEAYLSYGNCLIEKQSKTLLCAPKFGNAEIPKDGSVTTIGEKAFYNSELEQELVIPASVTTFKIDAFYGSGGFTAIKYEGTIEQWCNVVFENAYSHPMREVKADGADCSLFIGGMEMVGDFVLPKNITKINKYAFVMCGLDSFTLHEGVTEIGGYLGANTVKYEGTLEQWCSLTFGDSVGCSNLCVEGDKMITALTVPDSVTKIKPYTFAGFRGIKSVVFHDGVTEIGDYAFDFCTSISSLNLPENLEKIGDYAFRSIDSVYSIKIPSKVESIGDYAFCDSFKLTSAQIPDSVTELGEGVFSGCTSLTSVQLGNGITEIKKGTFDRCQDLKEIVIPASVTKINEYAFTNVSLDKVTVCGEVEQITAFTFGNNVPDDITFTVTDGWGIFDRNGDFVREVTEDLSDPDEARKLISSLWFQYLGRI